MKVMLGIPTYSGQIRVELTPFIAEFSPAEIFPVLHCPIDVARNLLVNEAQRRKADVLFMVDGDAVPKPGTRQALLDQAEKEVCVIGCPYYAAKHLACVRPFLKTATGICQADNIGTHCLAYNVKAFERIEPPYFYHEYNDRHTVQTNTEDYVCHDRLRQAGVPIYCHYDFWAGHVKDYNLTLS